MHDDQTKLKLYFHTNRISLSNVHLLGSFTINVELLTTTLLYKFLGVENVDGRSFNPTKDFLDQVKYMFG